jgi:hypothetical protein
MYEHILCDTIMCLYDTGAGETRMALIAEITLGEHAVSRSIMMH